jgi:hypothetical protein
MLHKNRLRVFFLFIVFVVGIGLTAPRQARGLENPPRNYEVPPSAPLQIVNLSKFQTSEFLPTGRFAKTRRSFYIVFLFLFSTLWKHKKVVTFATSI